ncbi:MAG: hypothetical protein NUV81_03695 [bacterium]|nr:hypothetical protein [bacterium]
MNRINHFAVRWSFRVASCFVVGFFAFFLLISSAHAGETYTAEVSSGAVTLAPSQVKLITLKFKNTGVSTWTSGVNKTAVYLYGKSTPFYHASWKANDLPVAIQQLTVRQGQMASASFYVTAPKTPGVYTERFLLSYGPNLWVKGSVVTVTFTVTNEIATPVVPVATEAVAPSSAWSAELVSLGGIEWHLEPGANTFVNVKLKNTGSKTWKREGLAFVSLYTWEPKYRTSPFATSLWKSGGQAGFLVEDEVKTGQTGTLRMEIRAPQKEGTYSETFQLAAENTAWISGGTITLPIQVGGTTVAVSSPAVTTEVPSTSQTGTTDLSAYQSVLLLTSNRSVTLAGNGRIELTHGFKNSGSIEWGSRGLQLVGLTPSDRPGASVRDTSWESDSKAVTINAPTKPGEIGFVNYTLKAPALVGSYTATFQLMADGNEVAGGEIEIPITVTSDGVVDSNPIVIPNVPIQDPSSTEPPILDALAGQLPDEPIIRVGIYATTDDTSLVRAIQGGMKALKNGVVVCTYKKMEVVTAHYNRTTGLYSLSGPGCSDSGSQYYVMQAEDGIAPLEVTDFSRPVSWLPGANDNTFRAHLELRYTPKTDKVWLINELPIEYYLYGLAETSDVSPLEFQKTLLTAARTYAMYHVNRGTKHADEFFTVDAKFDQVYRGYGQEARSPNIVKGINATRGYIVTYNGTLAITPYFSRSDGRTRNWNEVWGGSGYPWLVSVPVPHDIGQTLWGHGVGLSARGALYMASKDSATFDVILKHFYQGTELRRAYK